LNRWQITGRVLDRAPLRYTPAGLAVVEFTLDHENVVEQAGLPRQIKFEVLVVVMGDLAQMWQTLALNQMVEVEGFVAPLKKDSPRWRLHAEKVSLLKD